MSLFNQGEKAYLLLADGTILEGIHFGVKGTAIGEVVFTTGMTAYQETMTDPSYYGQLYPWLYRTGMVQYPIQFPDGRRCEFVLKRTEHHWHSQH